VAGRLAGASGHAARAGLREPDRHALVLADAAVAAGHVDLTAATYDVAVVGGGPGGSTAAAFLARAGLRVGLFEREAFPRLRVGESMLPAMLPLLDRLGARELIENHGFLVKYGAYFHEQETGAEQSFYFLEGKPWPAYSYEVPRGEFD